MSRIAITGGTGLIGSALVTTLEARGDEVVVLTRRAAHHSRELTWNTETGETADRARVANLDAVIHLAGAGIGDKRWTAATGVRFFCRGWTALAHCDTCGATTLPHVSWRDRPSVFMGPEAMMS